MKLENIEIEKRNRIRLSVAAYAYEFDDRAVMSDAQFDQLALKIQPSLLTGNATPDAFFFFHFKPFTSQWVHYHPEIDKLSALYYRLKGSNSASEWVT